jgi:hypothetical protein
MTRQSVKRFHLVSCTLIRQFCADGQTVAMRLDHPDSPPKRRFPAGLCYVKDLHPSNPQAFEGVWRGPEDHFPEILASVESGTIHGDGRLPALLLDFVALHIARSESIRVMSDSILPQILDRQISAARYDPRLLQDYFQRTGLIVHGAEGRSTLTEQLRVRMEMRIAQEPLIANQFVRQYERVADFLRGRSFDIIVASSGEFLLSDIPVALVRSNHPGVGTLGGVRVDGADQILMPLSRRHAVGISATDSYVEVPSAITEWLNHVQICSAQRRVMWHPDVDFHNFATATVNQVVPESPHPT